MAKARKSRGESLLLRYLVLGGWALVCLLPILWFLSIGFRPRTEVITPRPIYWPSFSLDAWRLLISDWPIAQYLRNSVWALMLIYAAINLSLVTWIIRSYMLDIPKELEDAARTDGAGDLTILREIIVPACLPGIITAAVIAAIFAINEFLFTLLIASTSKAYTMSVALANFTGGSDGIIYNAIALVSFIAFVPILILVILIQKHLSRGLTMGAVKG